jgi:hypothetical protein
VLGHVRPVNRREAVGGAVCAAVMLAGGLFAMRGMLAIAAASAACALVALVLVRGARADVEAPRPG